MIEARASPKPFGSAGGLGWRALRPLAGAADLARIMTTPEQLLNVTFTPLIFVLLFSYAFNGAIILPGHGSYRDYLIAGIFAVNMGGTAQGAAIGLAVDLSTGLIGATVIVVTGLAVGWQIHADLVDMRVVLGLALLFWPYVRRARR